MTLLATPTYYYLCEHGHRFHRKKADLTICYRCGGKVKLYGLADDTRYSDDPDGGSLEDLPGS